jgi:hypothetical protein
MKKIIDWIIYSSQDPAKLSLTVKGALTACIPLVIAIFGVVFNIQVDQVALLKMVSQASVVLGASLALVGAVRKVYITAKK